MAEYVVVYPFGEHKVGDRLTDVAPDLVARNYVVLVRSQRPVEGATHPAPKPRSKQSSQHQPPGVTE